MDVYAGVFGYSDDEIHIAIYNKNLLLSLVSAFQLVPTIEKFLLP